jgi:WD40 repeat protein
MFSPDGEWLVSGNEDGTVRIWGDRSGGMHEPSSQ